MKALLSTFILLLITGALVHAEIYHCNQNGKPIYSDRPCSTDGNKMSVMESAPQLPGEVKQQIPDRDSAKEQRLIHFRFQYEIADNEVRNKEKEIEETTHLTQNIEKQHQERLASLKQELQRIYRNSSYGKYREQQIRDQIQTENNSYLNRITIIRNRLNLLYDDLKRMKDRRFKLQEQIETLKGSDLGL